MVKRAIASIAAEKRLNFIGDEAKESVMSASMLAKSDEVEVKLSLEESRYLLRLLKEHVDYFRALAGNAKCEIQALQKLLAEKDTEIEGLKCLLKCCAVVFEKRIPITTDFIAELRRVAE